MKPLTNLQNTLLQALQKLGGEADIVELRFQTMFKYKSRVLSRTLQELKKYGKVTYIPDRTGGYRHGTWRLTPI